MDSTSPPEPGLSSPPPPDYAAFETGCDRLARRIREILISGDSTRHYSSVITEMAETVGVFKSQVSRTTIEAGAEKLKELAERTFHDIELLAVWIDGIQLFLWQVVRAAGVDPEGNKYVLGIR